MTDQTEADRLVETPRERAVRQATIVADEYGRQTGDDLDLDVLVEALGRRSVDPGEFREMKREAYDRGLYDGRQMAYHLPSSRQVWRLRIGLPWVVVGIVVCVVFLAILT